MNDPIEATIVDLEIRVKELEEELSYFEMKNEELNDRVNELEEIEEKYLKIIETIWRTI